MSAALDGFFGYLYEFAVGGFGFGVVGRLQPVMRDQGLDGTQYCACRRAPGGDVRELPPPECLDYPALLVVG